jgi:hypothetical protein
MNAIATTLDRMLMAAAAFVAGLAVGMLLAPAPGDQTRRRLATSARGAAESAGERAHDLAEPLAERARETARHLSERHLPLADDFDIVDPDALREALRTGLSGE